MMLQLKFFFTGHQGEPFLNEYNPFQTKDVLHILGADDIVTESLVFTWKYRITNWRLICQVLRSTYSGKTML